MNLNKLKSNADRVLKALQDSKYEKPSQGLETDAERIEKPLSQLGYSV